MVYFLSTNKKTNNQFFELFVGMVGWKDCEMTRRRRIDLILLVIPTCVGIFGGDLAWTAFLLQSNGCYVIAKGARADHVKKASKRWVCIVVVNDL